LSIDAKILILEPILKVRKDCQVLSLGILPRKNEKLYFEDLLVQKNTLTVIKVSHFFGIISPRIIVFSLLLYTALPYFINYLLRRAIESKNAQPPTTNLPPNYGLWNMGMGQSTALGL
jgi:hypothetical protein